MPSDRNGWDDFYRYSFGVAPFTIASLSVNKLNAAVMAVHSISPGTARQETHWMPSERQVRSALLATVGWPYGDLTAGPKA